MTDERTDVSRLAERLEASEQRLRFLVEQVVDYAIIGLDTRGRIVSWNLGAERLKGYSAEEAIGRDFTSFYTPEDRAGGLPGRLLALARENGHVEDTGWRVRKDGTLFWADVVITALHDADGGLTGYAKVTRDRSDVKALEDAQDAFYAAFTHDFRTPLTAIRGFVDVVRDADETERDHLLDRIGANADKVLTMVEELVGFATQRAGHAHVVLGRLDLGDVARATVADLPLDLRPERVRVGEGGAPAYGNVVAMHRVVTNLVVNALKYSSSDSDVEISFGPGDPGRTELRVTDHGRGIDPGDHALVFEEFQRGRLAREDGGTGLGLASVRELVRQQGGEVRVSSEVGAGTTMTVSLPSGQDQEPSGQSAG